MSTLSQPRRSDRLSIWVLAGAVAILTWPGNEFGTEGGTLWYRTRVLGVPISYPILAGLLVVLALLTTNARVVNVRSRLADLGLWRWVTMGWMTTMLALALAILQQSREPFVDWRNFAVIALAVPILARWLEGRRAVEFLLPDLAILYGLIALVHLMIFLGGGGTYLFDVRIPLFDGFDLSLAVFGCLVATTCWFYRSPTGSATYRALLLGASVANALLVLLSFRRSFWAFLVAGFMAVVLHARRNGRLRAGAVIGVGVVTAVMLSVTVVALGTEAVLERLGSFNPFIENEYSATSRDHVNDIADAARVIAENPILGLGLGQTYETQLISNWKPESFEVHNAFLNAWLKFGLLGLITFVGFHLALIRALFRTGVDQAVALVGAGGAVVGEQLVNLVQPWAYNSLQFSSHRAVVLAVLVTVGWQQIRTRNQARVQTAV